MAKKKMPVKKMMHSENEMGGKPHMMSIPQMNQMMGGKMKPKRRRKGSR